MAPCCAKPAEPVFIDLETRSHCDLKAEGGWRYAKHPTTRLLTVSWAVDGQYHVWLPGADKVPPSFLSTHLPGVTVHLKDGDRTPRALLDVTDRPWVAHNAWTFDRTVWQALRTEGPRVWLDTYPLALAAGWPGGVNAIGKMLWGEGKYEEGAKELKTAMKCSGLTDCEPDNVPIGRQVLVAKYNVQDVRLLAGMWPRLHEELRLTPEERRVLLAHDAVNARGVRVDTRVLRGLIALSDENKAHAVAEIARLTGGALPDETALQSRNRVFAWLDKMGVSVGGSLRKEIIARWVEEHEDALEELEADGDEADAKGRASSDVPPNLALVVRVLQLRASALRITAGKLRAATDVIDADGRVRGWAVYWGAHTGRWTARRIQPHNIPRPKEGVDTWRLRERLHRAYADPDVGPRPPFDYEWVKSTLPTDKVFKHLTPDDAASSMLKNIFTASPGKAILAADLSNIEARFLARLAREKWLMEAFWKRGDPYVAMAQRVFGPTEKWPQYPDPDKPGQSLPVKKHPYRQVGKVIELGCGYQLGAKTFAVYAASNGIDLEAVGTTPQACITAYRRGHPAIAGEEAGEYNGVPYFKGGYWDQVEAACLAVVERRGSVAVGDVVFECWKGHLHAVLPSGRRIVYRDAAVEERDYFGKPKATVVYTSARFGGKRIGLYGGKITENVVQGGSRDVIAHGVVLCEEDGIPIVLHVHDEAVGEEDESRFPDFMRHVTTCPEWLTDFPLDAEGCAMPCYSKAPPPGKKDVVWRNGRPL